MHRRVSVMLLLILVLGVWFVCASAQDTPAQSPTAGKVASIKPNFMPPTQILGFLGAKEAGGKFSLEWKDAGGWHSVDIRHNDAANLLVVSGATSDVAYVEAMIREADIAPRQIQIEVKIVEISTSRARDLGIDWEQLMTDALPSASWAYRESSSDDYSGQTSSQDYSYRSQREIVTDDYDNSQAETRDDHIRDWRNTDRGSEDISRSLQITASMDLGRVVKFLDESGAAETRNAPRILTLNNRWANILDGERVTYVTRYSSYTNLFETDSMDAGLALKVLPSLGESGYITLRINAELTDLHGSISGSPVKSGQMVENTVIVKDGQSVLLGGLSRTVDQTVTRRFPLLGHVIPFLFSREIKIHDRIESFIVLTPRVVDFSVAIDAATMERIEGN